MANVCHRLAGGWQQDGSAWVCPWLAMEIVRARLARRPVTSAQNGG